MKRLMLCGSETDEITGVVVASVAVVVMDVMALRNGSEMILPYFPVERRNAGHSNVNAWAEVVAICPVL